MDCVHAVHPALLLLWISALSHATPSRFSLFQGSPYSSSAHQQRNKNWCAFVVHRNVTCAVLDTERVVDPQVVPCPPNQPHCSHSLTYRAHIRPMYKVGYKLVTELEWRCCPGYRGHDCMELKDALSAPQTLHELRPDPPSIPRQQQSVLGPEVFAGGHPWTQTGATRHPLTQGEESRRPGSHQESNRVQKLEDEVQRLSQTVLDLQAAMTTANANLRLDLQEDASKIIQNLLGNFRQPQGALAGDTESILLPSDIPFFPAADELQSQVTYLSNTISTNTNSIQDLDAKLLQLEEHMKGLREAKSATMVPVPPPSSTTECPCQAYVDEQLEALRKEMMEGMDIKMADLKNACEYKVLSVKEQCEEQENSYLSLTELLDSKEADLRQEIQDLQNFISAGSPQASLVPDLQTEIQNLKTAQGNLTSAMNATVMKQKAQEEALETRVSLMEGNMGGCCLNLEEKMRKERAKEEEAQSKALESKISEVLQVLGSTQLQVTPTSGQHVVEMEQHTEILKGEVGSLTQQVKVLQNSIEILNQSITPQSHTHGLFTRLDKLEEDCGRGQELAERLEEKLSGVDGRVTSIESVCGRLEPMSDSLTRIKDGLNKHVNGLWNCVRQLNNTVLTQSTDIDTLRAGIHTSVDGQDRIIGTPQYTGVRPGMEDSSIVMEKGLTPPVLESGEAGPPGTKLSSQTPQGTNGSIPPIKGYAAAPGYPPLTPVSNIPRKLPGQKSVSSPVSFSAGLTISPFSGDMSIIRFNQVLLNEGGHYDPHTGIFTVPTDGRYLLTAVITAQKGARVEAVLSVANRSIQRLDTSGSGGMGSAECLCGGSASASLVLDLKHGQKVGVVMTSGRLAISTSTEVLSTFSGVLLYPSPAKR